MRTGTNSLVLLTAPNWLSHNRSQAVVAEPYCIIQPADRSAVSTALKIIDFFHVKFAIRSGGHSPNPGFSSIDEGGVLLDMKGRDEISLSEDKTAIRLGSGARWVQVVEVTDSNGVAVVGGRLPTIGVGGFMLGGKWRWNQRFQLILIYM